MTSEPARGLGAAPFTSSATRQRSTWLRVLLALVGGTLATVAATIAYQLATDDVLDDRESVVLLLALPFATTAALLRRSRWWVRGLVGLLGIVVTFVCFAVLIAIALSGIDFAAVG